MKTALIHAFGGPEQVTLGNADEPLLQPHEVLVRVAAASVNPLDVKIVASYMQQVFPVEFPYAVGTDFSGVVAAIGNQVTNVKMGDRVVGRSSPVRGGAFAQGVVIPAVDLCAPAANMSFEQAAALPTAFGTAWQALFDVGGLQSGQRVLIHAGAGGVGSFAIQLARRAGAHVIATASAANLDLVKELGAHEAIDYRVQGFSHLSGIELVLDTIGGETLEKSWAVLRPGGRIATLADFAIQGQDGKTGEFVFFKSATAALPEAMKMFEAGQLQVVVDSSFALEEVRAALEKVATGHARGKVLIRANHLD
ncbi:MAG TPA: NADP-dependent oxidoreductase [Steroidobacter sp.]|uniref:NADP-dependent oxidoreductase n=1 Tax=Steroidobacter sp. TaxID=1978227 RepID=UPI002ED8A6CF